MRLHAWLCRRVCALNLQLTYLACWYVLSRGLKFALCPADKGSDYDNQGGMGQQGGGMGQQGGMMGQQVPPGSMLSYSALAIVQAAQRQ